MRYCASGICPSCAAESQLTPVAGPKDFIDLHAFRCSDACELVLKVCFLDDVLSPFALQAVVVAAACTRDAPLVYHPRDRLGLRLQPGQRAIGEGRAEVSASEDWTVAQTVLPRLLQVLD